MALIRATVFLFLFSFLVETVEAQFQLDIEQVADKAFPKVVEEEEPPTENTSRIRHGFDVQRNIDAWVFNRFGLEENSRCRWTWAFVGRSRRPWCQL